MRISDLLESENTYIGTVKNKKTGVEFDVHAASPANRVGERSSDLVYLVDKNTGKRLHKFASTRDVEQYYDWIRFPGKFNEAATAGATSSASIATVPNPHLSPGSARGKKSYIGTPGRSGTKAPPQPKPKSQTPADNALNMKGTSIFGGPAIKR